ncbi:eukaryotic peptide chain release factor GTP-binding subunit ERF3A [Trifolium repens]|nr:eukaryotic peptide chain release factor GTP-binding subunit ERF3A [Trifolium repens]
MPTNLNIFFYAGKSTTGGQILFLSGQVDDRTIQKYEKEANDKSRESCICTSERNLISVGDGVILQFLLSSGLRLCVNVS